MTLRKNVKSKLLYGFFRSIIGLALVAISWFNPLEFGTTIRIVVFILGFDMMSILPKVGIFILNVFFPFEQLAYLSWTLLILFVAELAIAYTDAYKPYRLIIKPVAVFAVAYISLGLQPALIAAGLDLLINLTHKIRVGK